ncbi:MAG: hypothetical protein ACRBBR_01775 [Cellvibrionaceae bacterium]
MKIQYFLFFVLSLFSLFCHAGEADVTELKVRYNGSDSFQIITTVKHADTGWDHYADGWEILDEQGNVLGKRVLYHPHVKEQPFTRSHTLIIPKTVKEITVRALDSVHGIGGKERTIVLDRTL